MHPSIRNIYEKNYNIITIYKFRIPRRYLSLYVHITITCWYFITRFRELLTRYVKEVLQFEILLPSLTMQTF